MESLLLKTEICMSLIMGDRITVWDSNGKFLNSLGKYGSGEGQFNNPIDLAIGGGEIFVVEQSNHRVQVFDMNGTFLRKWGAHGSQAGNFRSPLLNKFVDERKRRK